MKILKFTIHELKKAAQSNAQTSETPHPIPRE